MQNVVGTYEERRINAFSQLKIWRSCLLLATDVLYKARLLKAIMNSTLGVGLRFVLAGI